MSDEVNNRLVRIETKVDVLLEGRLESERTKTDVVWLKGGMAIVLSIILSCAGWLAMNYFQTVGG